MSFLVAVGGGIGSKDTVGEYSMELLELLERGSRYAMGGARMDKKRK